MNLLRLSLIGAASAALLPAAGAQAQDPSYVGEVQLFGSTACPSGTLEGNGQLVSTSSYPGLFAVIGDTYRGGNGSTTFAVPDLRGRTAMHVGQGPGHPSYILGQMGGSETTTISVAQMPAHTHESVVPAVDDAADSRDPAGASLADFPDNQDVYSDRAPDTPMAAGTAVVPPSGGANQPFDSRNPVIALRRCVSTVGRIP